jgi:Protein of unknown function (DUF2442)
MSTLVDTVRIAAFIDGHILVRMEGGVEMRFPVSRNPRLAKGTADQLNNIEISPFGLHWPDLDEDLSFRGIAEGNFGQYQKEECRTRHSTWPREVSTFRIGVEAVEIKSVRILSRQLFGNLQAPFRNAVRFESEQSAIETERRLARPATFYRCIFGI